ncbi:hypothetical protein BDR03DRAFT_946645 [Suillus americanus]|nr:hypothetical protein BDR03DRAFT_946645 [Suillus americanus]
MHKVTPGKRAARYILRGDTTFPVLTFLASYYRAGLTSSLLLDYTRTRPPLPSGGPCMSRSCPLRCIILLPVKLYSTHYFQFWQNCRNNPVL